MLNYRGGANIVPKSLRVAAKWNGKQGNRYAYDAAVLDDQEGAEGQGPKPAIEAEPGSPSKPRARAPSPSTGPRAPAPGHQPPAPG